MLNTSYNGAIRNDHIAIYRCSYFSAVRAHTAQVCNQFSSVRVVFLFVLVLLISDGFSLFGKKYRIELNSMTDALAKPEIV